MAGEIANAVGQTLTGIGGSIASIINTNKSIKANKAMAEYSYSKDLEMWNRQNAYNTPQAQMQRFKDAQLNPNLMYGQGSSGNASSMPKYQAPKLDYNYESPKLGNALAYYQDAKLKQAQIDSVETQTKRTDQLTTNAMIDETLKNLDAQIKALAISTGRTKLDYLPLQLQQAFRKNESSIRNLDVGTELKKYQSTYTESKTNEINRLLSTKQELMKAQINKMVSDTGLNKYKAGALISNMANVESAIKMRKANIGQIEQRSALLDKENKYYWTGKAIQGANATAGTLKGWYDSMKRGQFINTRGKLNIPKFK